MARSPRARRGKIYIDALQNGYGKLLVAPYSVRPLPGATVSMPLNWREVNGKLDPAPLHDRDRAGAHRALEGRPAGPGARRGQPDLRDGPGRLLAEQG